MLILADTIYFKARWAQPFKEEYTEPALFNLPDGTTISVPMMNNRGLVANYAEGEGYQAAEFAHWGHDYSMTVLLPSPGKFTDFERALDLSKLTGILNNLEPTELIVSMPKFEDETDYVLNQTLKDMGMKDAFGNADFSGMTNAKGLYITETGQKTFISVDENGTEAAAAATVVWAGVPYDEFNMNRPFIYFIKDNSTGTILFLGRVLKPPEYCGQTS